MSRIILGNFKTNRRRSGYSMALQAASATRMRRFPRGSIPLRYLSGFPVLSILFVRLLFPGPVFVVLL